MPAALLPSSRPQGSETRHEIFDSLRRWMGSLTLTEEPPAEHTLAGMDAGGVKQALSAWHGPQRALVANDEVAGSVARAP